MGGFMKSPPEDEQLRGRRDYFKPRDYRATRKQLLGQQTDYSNHQKSTQILSKKHRPLLTRGTRGLSRTKL
jgi:hypothetical protein